MKWIFKFPRVRWSEVCIPKKCGRLGVKDIWLVNLALLSKWIWRSWKGSFSLWYDILASQYGSYLVSSWCPSRFYDLRNVSSWGKVMSLKVSKKYDPPNWFESGLVKKVRFSLSTFCWEDPWLGSVPLKIRFQRLFSISKVPKGMVGEVGRCVQGLMSWNLRWRKSFFVHEEPLVTEFFWLFEKSILIWRLIGRYGFTL